MKTTVDIQDELLARAKKLAARSGRPLRAVVEEGLRRVLSDKSSYPPYRLPECSVGNSSDANPLENMSWQDLRAEIYGEPDAR